MSSIPDQSDQFIRASQDPNLGGDIMLVFVLRLLLGFIKRLLYITLYRKKEDKRSVRFPRVIARLDFVFTPSESFAGLIVRLNSINNGPVIHKRHIHDKHI